MGIPSFFAQILKRNPGCIEKTLARSPEYLFVDYNCLVHRCVKSASTDDTVVEEATRYLLDVIRLFNPRRVFVATDGVPPVAKMAQQRRRRFMACLDSREGAWNRNKITPGTRFMDTLNARTLRALELLPDHISWTFSGSDKPGEGEQKIMSVYRTFDPDDTRGFAIYGLDADLIVLSMVLKDQGFHPPTLCRERGDPGVDDSFIYVHTETLVEELFEGLAPADIQNYVVCSFLCGNDFCVPASFITVRDGWQSRLFDLCRNANLQLVDKSSNPPAINWTDMTRLIRLLYDIEDSEMKNADRAFWKTQAPDPENDDFYPLTHKDPADRCIRPGTPGWRERYYSRLFKTTCPHDVQRACLRYAQGLQWTLDYYYAGKHVDWHYPHHYSPTLADLYHACSAHGALITASLRAGRTLDVPEDLLLAIVTPVFSADLVPKRTVCCMTDPALGLVHMYPSRAELMTYLKRRKWECHPSLPPLQIPTAFLRT